MTYILGLSGKKQSGKNTAANYLLAHWFQKIGYDASQHPVSGKVVVDGLQVDFEDRQNPTVQRLTADLGDRLKFYLYADLLKETCINVLGLSYAQCHGSDADKNTPTHLRWEDMPGVIATEFPHEWDYEVKEMKLICHAPGLMTAREVLQFFGTDIIRKMYQQAWVNGTLRKIHRDRPQRAVITDCRFPDEILGITGSGGTVLRLGREFPDAVNHSSETALDRDRFDWTQFSLVLDNQKMSIPEQGEAMAAALRAGGMQYFLE
jgi:hypothetical protein